MACAGGAREHGTLGRRKSNLDIERSSLLLYRTDLGLLIWVLLIQGLLDIWYPSKSPYL